MTTQAITPAGWYPDPDHHHQYRYWSGTEWTPMVSDNAVTATDPLQSPAQPASAPGTSTLSGQQRYWDGRAWTERTAPAGANGLALAAPTPTSRAARRKQRAIERAQPLLPPGIEIRQIFGATTGSPLLLIVLMLLLAVLPGALVFSVISKNRWIVVAPDAIYVLDCGHFGRTPKSVHRVLPRATRLGPPGGVWTKIHAGPDTLWAGKDIDIAAADAEAAGFGAPAFLPVGYGAPAVLPVGYGAPAVLPAGSKNPVLHAVASFFIPGLGTLLCGKTARGLLILGLSAVSLLGVNLLANALISGDPTGIGTFIAIPLWVWGVVDGYRSAQQWNREHVGEAELPLEKTELAASPTQHPNQAVEFHGQDLPGGDIPTHAAAGTVTEAQTGPPEGMQMGTYICDVCSTSLPRSEVKFCDSATMHRAVRNGLNPWKTPGISSPSSPSVNLGTLFGMGSEDLYQSWRERALADMTPWGLCPSCNQVVGRM